ncbi:hypothetical protein D3C80_2157250 [compost metagenome]
MAYSGKQTTRNGGAGAREARPERQNLEHADNKGMLVCNVIDGLRCSLWMEFLRNDHQYTASHKTVYNGLRSE